jgi:hypothetical protein
MLVVPKTEYMRLASVYAQGVHGFGHEGLGDPDFGLIWPSRGWPKTNEPSH